MILKINRMTVDKLFSFFIVMLPFMYQYRGVGESISFGELVFGVRI